MSNTLLESLYSRGLVSAESYEKMKAAAGSQKLSLHLELRALLYLGVLLISSGAGALVYKHIDQLGHLVIVGGLTTACLACYGFSAWKRNRKDDKPVPVLFDYIILLGSLLLLIDIGYLQSQFQLFGNRWGLASFIPMVILFATAYYFDHKGVLSLAIINLAAWAGININKGSWYGIRELNEEATIITAALLSVALILWARFVKGWRVKPHFANTYLQFGCHGLFIAAIAGEIQFSKLYLLWLALLVGTGLYFLRKASKENSAYYMVISCLYVYMGLSYVFTAKVFSRLQGETELYANLFYYLFTGIGMAFLLSSLNKKIKSNDPL